MRDHGVKCLMASVVFCRENRKTWVSLVMNLTSCTTSILQTLLGEITTTKAELKLFHQRLSHLECLPCNAMEALSLCSQDIYPNVFRLLQLLATLPVSSTTNECSFSTLKRIKMYLRSTTAEIRLNGLAMMTVHREEGIDIQMVINDLAKLGSRRLNFVL
jgi:hypothetical protein